MTGPENVQLVVAESVELGLVRGSTSKDVVARATETANVLAEVIQSRKLFATISNKRYVRCEGWTTLAALMGFIPREASMTRREDGSYEAVAELVRITDGVVLSRASAECGVGEPTWKARADYARRSMAATRATSKVCRLAFSWVMGLAGFEVTPFEEIPEEERGGARPSTKDAGPKELSVAPTPQPLKNQTAQQMKAMAQDLQDARAGGVDASEQYIPPPQPLTEKPKALAAKEEMPWEVITAAGPVVWPYGAKKGTPLNDLTSAELLASQKWIERTGRGRELSDAIETILAGRDGE